MYEVDKELVGRHVGAAELQQLDVPVVHLTAASRNKRIVYTCSLYSVKRIAGLSYTNICMNMIYRSYISPATAASDWFFYLALW